MQNLEINSGAGIPKIAAQIKMPSKIGYSGSVADLIRIAVTNKQLTRAQANALLRHKSHHSEGHMLFMLKSMIDKHLTFGEAHERAMKAVGK